MRRVLATAVFAAAMTSGAAFAADLGYDRVAPGARPYVYNWQGFYVGANLGYQWGKVTNNSTNPEGFTGGAGLGYNWQYSSLVYGIETDIQLSGADDSVSPSKFANSWYGTLRGRGGFAFNNVLIYGTAGLAYGGLRGESTLTGASESKTLGGWTAGVGMELGLTPVWTLKAEYLWIALAGRGYTVTGANNGLESSILRVGANYRF